MPIKRLFWKIFATFWLASLAIMVATFYTVTNRMEAEHHRLLYQRAVNNFAEHLIAGYETYPAETAQKTYFLQHLARNIPGGSRAHPVLAIYHGDRLIYSRERLREHEPAPIAFNITSASGQAYRIEAAPRPPRLLRQALQRMMSVQLVFILLGSTAVSFLLSWSITRPLKKLGAASRQFAQGDTQTQIDPHLLRRADEIGDLAQDFAFMMQRTRQTLAAQKQLLHDVSHELRAPLSRLQVAAALIQQREKQDSPPIQRIHSECERMDQLIQRILNFARLEESAPTLAPVDLIELLSGHVDTLKFEYPQRQIRLDNRVHPEKPEHPIIVDADSPLLGEAVDNILRNACKYTPEDTAIDMTVSRRDARILIAIRDHGPGVPTQDLDRLGTPFYRSGNRMHGDGFGLGLSIARRALEKHGGSLSMANHPQGGLQVTLALPEKSAF